MSLKKEKKQANMSEPLKVKLISKTCNLCDPRPEHN
jgi:hypothetical protein